MVNLYGDCVKIDLAVIVATIMEVIEGKDASIFTDRSSNYSVFDKEISGVPIQEISKSISVYDLHTTVFKEGHTYAVTDGSPQSITSILNRGFEAKKTEIIYLDTGSKEGLDAIKNTLGSEKFLVFPYSKSRQIDILNSGRLKGSHLDSLMIKFIKEFTERHYELSKAEISLSVKGVRRRFK